jgi:DNA-directed RNA polymerase specialized sigma24 family protein
MAFANSEDELRDQARRGYPRTHWEAIEGIRSPEDPDFTPCWSELFRTYHPLAYVYFRRQHVPHEEAKDLVAGFFHFAIEKGWFRTADPERGRFRDLLRTALHRFWVDDVRKIVRKDRRLKEALAGDLSPDWGFLERIAASGLLADEAMDRAEAEGVMERGKALAVERARGTNREVWFTVLERWAQSEEAGEGLRYADLASLFGLQRSDVTNYLHRAREAIQSAVKEVIAAGVHASSDDERFRLVNELYQEYLDTLHR